MTGPARAPDTTNGPVRRNLPGLAWPLVLTGQAAMLEVLQSQFALSERDDPQQLRAAQMRQIAQLAAHAHARSPFWRGRLGAAGYSADAPAERWFAALPVLDRRGARDAGAELRALPTPPEHGNLHSLKTSGSTGTPLELVKTELADLFWQAITLREALWHGRDLTGKLAAIRVGAARETLPHWHIAYAGYANGPCVTFDARSDIDAQLDWLVAEAPHYLLTHASNLRALALRSLARKVRLDGLLEARSFSECPAADLCELVEAAWGVGVVDLYSANEAGYVALQCPVSGLYHVQSEDVLVEILDVDGAPCPVGQSGRVVVTPLHNFATPLLRYDLGDHATVGPPCPCGRTLPTLSHILGRTRNLVRLPGGRTAWPGLPMTMLTRLDAIAEFRMIQHRVDAIEVEMVLTRDLTGEEQDLLRSAICKRLEHDFDIRLTRVEAIDRSGGYKFEDFLCLVD